MKLCMPLSKEFIIFQAYPGKTEDSLVRRATQSLQTSEELRTKGLGLKTTVAEQVTDLNKQQIALGSVGGTLDIINSRINALHTRMDTYFAASQLIFRLHFLKFTFCILCFIT